MMVWAGLMYYNNYWRTFVGTLIVSQISGFRRDVEICALLGYYAVYWLPVTALTFPFRNYVTACRLSFLLGLLTLEDGTDLLSRNVGKQLPHDAAQKSVGLTLTVPQIPWRHKLAGGTLILGEQDFTHILADLSISVLNR